METYNTTAHKGLLKDGFHPPVPLQVLGQTKGRLYTPEELARRFSRALFPRPTSMAASRSTATTFMSKPAYPKRASYCGSTGSNCAVLDHMVLAEYRCRYDWREHHVKGIRDGVFYPTRFASPQGALIPLTPQESLIVYRPKSTGAWGNAPCPCSNCGSSNLCRQREAPASLRNTVDYFRTGVRML